MPQESITRIHNLFDTKSLIGARGQDQSCTRGAGFPFICIVAARQADLLVATSCAGPRSQTVAGVTRRREVVAGIGVTTLKAIEKNRVKMGASSAPIGIAIAPQIPHSLQGTPALVQGVIIGVAFDPQAASNIDAINGL